MLSRNCCIPVVKIIRLKLFIICSILATENNSVMALPAGGGAVPPRPSAVYTAKVPSPIVTKEAPTATVPTVAPTASKTVQAPSPVPGVICANQPVDPYPGFGFCYDRPVPDEPQPTPTNVPTRAGSTTPVFSPGSTPAPKPTGTTPPRRTIAPTPTVTPEPELSPINERKYLGCADVDGTPIDTQECIPEERKCILPETVTEVHNECVEENKTCVVKQVSETEEKGKLCMPVICEKYLWKGGGNSCEGCKSFAWIRDGTNKCWYRDRYSLRCELTEAPEFVTLPCVPDMESPPEVPGQDGGFYLPNPACFDRATHKCGAASCDFFVTKSANDECNLLDKPVEVPGGGVHATCSKVDSPDFTVSEPPIYIQRFECSREGDTPAVF